MNSLIESLVATRTIRKEDIIDYIMEISKKCDLHITNVTFINNGCSGYYDYKTNIININYDKILDTFRSKEIKNINNFNFEILLTIIHELAHAVQQKQIYDDETYKKFPTYYTFLISNYFSIVNDNDFYCENHDDFAIEYSANVIAYLNTIDLLKKYHLDYSIVEMQYKNYLKKHESFNLEKNIFDENLLENIANSEIRDDILFKYRYALQNYGTEENLTQEERAIYGYKK